MLECSFSSPRLPSSSFSSPHTIFTSHHHHTLFTSSGVDLNSSSSQEFTGDHAAEWIPWIAVEWVTRVEWWMLDNHWVGGKWLPPLTLVSDLSLSLSDLPPAGMNFSFLLNLYNINFYFMTAFTLLCLSVQLVVYLSVILLESFIFSNTALS